MFKLVVTVGKMFHHLFEDKAALHLMAKHTSQRYGVGGIADKIQLIYVQTDTYHRLSHAMPFQHIFYEKTCNLLVAEIDIIGPLDGKPFRIFLQSLLHRKGGHLRKTEHFLGIHPFGMEKKAEKKILPSLRLPDIRARSSSRSLIFCSDKNHSLPIRCPIMTKEIIRRINAVEFQHLEHRRIIEAKVSFHHIHLYQTGERKASSMCSIFIFGSLPTTVTTSKRIFISSLKYRTYASAASTVLRIFKEETASTG